MSDILSQFKALKLHGMAECYAELQAQAKQAPLKTSAQQLGYFVNYWPQKRLIEVYELYVIR